MILIDKYLISYELIWIGEGADCDLRHDNLVLWDLGEETDDKFPVGTDKVQWENGWEDGNYATDGV